MIKLISSSNPYTMGKLVTQKPREADYSTHVTMNLPQIRGYGDDSELNDTSSKDGFIPLSFVRPILITIVKVRWIGRIFYDTSVQSDRPCSQRCDFGAP